MSFAPLEGVRVVDVTASLAGPSCTQLLAALGADVVKVEPREGDHARAWGPPFVDGDGVLFFAANAGKRSLAVDLEEDIDTVLRLVDEADVFVQSLRPGLAERRGLGADALRARNPRLVYCTIGAYGNVGPLADRPGYDPLMQAATGLMSVTGEADGPPVRAGVSLIDFATDSGRRSASSPRCSSASTRVSAARSIRRCTRPRWRSSPRSSPRMPRRARHPGGMDRPSR